MTFHSTPNKFRSSLSNGPDELVAKVKKPKADRSSDGLCAVSVPRSEVRRNNQRGAKREPIPGEQAIIRSKGRARDVELVNLSRGGAMVAGKLGLDIWENVDLILGEFGTVECAVRWIRGQRCGLEFAHETHIDCDKEVENEVLRNVLRNCFPEVEPEPVAVADEPALDGEPGRARRHALIWNGIVYHDYETDVVRLRNISATGVLIECSASFPAGGAVELELDGVGRIPANVCWSRGAQSGLAFEQPFDLHRLSKAPPEVAPADWVQPDYLQLEDEQSSPWADRWNRLTLSELSYTLRV